MQHTFSFLSSQATSICGAVLLLGLLVGCDAFGLDGPPPNSEPHPLRTADSTVVGPGLQITLRTPDTVALGDSFRMQLQTENPTGHPVSVISGSACMYRFGIYEGDETVPVEGAGRVCAAVQTEISVMPGVRTRRYDLQAARASSNAAPVSPGAYAARAALSWRIDGAAVKDTVETTIVFTDE